MERARLIVALLPLCSKTERHMIDRLIVAPTRSITWWKLAALTFIAVAGGGFGIEDSVRAGGALPVFLAMPLVVVLFALPQAAVTAELVNMFPVNGGYVVWVSSALGRPCGFVAAVCGCSAAAFDLGLALVLLKVNQL
jgi:amino acid transporter